MSFGCKERHGDAMPKVFALKSHVKDNVRHPLVHHRFDENGVAEWPLDQFTQRRVRDGDVSLTPPAETTEQTEFGN
jgi:hypothetical protein